VRSPVRLAVLLLPLSAVGCASLADGARDHFVAAHSCPADRVVVKARPDLGYGDLLPAPAAAVPSAEVAGDPERLALWQEQQARARAERRASANARYDVFEVSGCGRTVRVGCRHPEDERGRTERSAVTCSSPEPLVADAPAPGADE
jgi:hypothetical protein